MEITQYWLWGEISLNKISDRRGLINIYANGQAERRKMMKMKNKYKTSE